ncbi:uncharacterized protein LOC123192484 [Mangifera indica]|uniref:uncharacterized protein LOC123192484 n=1 Tax=Mangifera indica TaxID=29780 RepID=UPI001CFB7C8A|nr:uncharacterized protein LOC123192484 [Mangifera indica]
MAENAESASKKHDFQNILSLLPKIELKLPFFNKEPKQVEPAGVKKSQKTSVERENVSVKPNLVRFPDRQMIPAKLEFEAEEPAGRTSNPVVLWQVYALGGILVLRWVWARWKERKERAGKKDSSDDNNDTPANDDDDHHSA